MLHRERIDFGDSGAVEADDIEPKVSRPEWSVPGLVGGRVVGGVTSRVRSGARRTMKSAGLVDAPSSIGTVVSTRIALTNSRLACGLPLTSTRITAPFFCASVPCQAVVIQSNSGRARRDEAAIAIGSKSYAREVFFAEMGACRWSGGENHPHGGPALD